MEKDIVDFEFPRILVLNSQNINKNNPTGITLRSVLSCIPKDKLLQVFRFEPWNPTSDPLDVKSIQIPPKAMPISYFFRKNLGAAMEKDKKPSENKAQGGVAASRQSTLKVLFKAILDNSIIVPDRGFLSRIDEFDPEIIYTLGGEICIQKWALYLSKRYNCKVVMHYMDNWRQTAFLHQKNLRFMNRFLNKQLEKLENRMNYGMVISEAMSDAYESKYHHHYIPLMNVVETFSVNEIEHPKLTIVYAGGLHLNRYETLLKVEKAIRQFAKVRLLIYTSQENITIYKSLFDVSITEFRVAVDHSNIVSVYEESDILLHIESFEPNDIEYTKYSLSTKISEYMMSGKPIICFAPSCIAAYQYINKSGAGIGVESLEQFVEAIQILSNRERRKSYGAKGIEAAKANHSLEIAMKGLKKVFTIGE